MTIYSLFVNILTCGDIMISKYEQKDFYLRIKNLYLNKKYNIFEKEATKYLDSFPDDINLRFMRAKTYRNLNKFEEAIADLKYILKLEYNEYALTELYFIYYYTNKYKEALDLLPLIYEKRPINAYSVSISETVMRKQLGMPIKLRKGVRCDYIRGQVIEYDEEESLNHINKHLTGNEENISYFNEGINITYLFNLIKNNIDNSKKVNIEEMMEIHYFGIGNIGKFNDEYCNFVKVVVIPNTNNIISMYPTNSVDYNYVSNIEVDYDKLFKRDNKVKTMSRIDKFNKKYNM